MAAHHPVSNASDIWSVLFACWLFGIMLLGGLGEAWRRTRKHGRQALELRSKAAAIRHQRKLELACARAGLPLPDRKKRVPTATAGNCSPLPAAAVAAPPGAQPVTGIPGACRHERVIPVIGADGDLKRWICANHGRCAAEFDKSIAVYEPEEKR